MCKCVDVPNKNKPINETVVSVFIDYYIYCSFLFLKLGLPYLQPRPSRAPPIHEELFGSTSPDDDDDGLSICCIAILYPIHSTLLGINGGAAPSERYRRTLPPLDWVRHMSLEEDGEQR